MNNTYIISNQLSLRPCLVNGQKALFHKWVHDSSNDNLYGLVEMENGNVHIIDPVYIRFLDTKSKMIDFANFFKEVDESESN